MQLDRAMIEEVVRRALEEDLGGAGDLTSQLCVPESRRSSARILAREPGIIAGLPVAAACFRAVDEAVELELRREDGDEVAAGDVVLSVAGSSAALMAAERSALNFMQRLSGIATRTSEFVAAVGASGARVFDTRKTTPGLRMLEKYAVRVGGGQNHRVGLFDQVMIKENHVALAAPTPYEEVVKAAVDRSGGPVVAEARDIAEAISAVRAGAAVVMLDNIAPGDALRCAVADVRAEAARLGRSVEIESSGGVTLDNVRGYAECGVDRVSVGALTHSVRSLDLSMLVEEVS